MDGPRSSNVIVMDIGLLNAVRKSLVTTQENSNLRNLVSNALLQSAEGSTRNGYAF